MTSLTDEIKARLGVALNEATLLGAEVDTEGRRAAVTLSVLTLPESGPSPEDPRVSLLLAPVGRVVASLREGRWDQSDAEIVPFAIGDLLSVVRSLRGQAIYGWEFFDRHEEELQSIGDRISMEWAKGDDGVAHSLMLFQEQSGSEPRHLDLLIWFDHLEIRTPSGDVIPIERFCDDGRRWWDGLHSGDPRTEGHGIFPGSPDDDA